MGGLGHWSPHVASWTAWLIAGGLLPSTIQQRRYQLSRLAKIHADRSPWELTVEDLAAYLASHQWGRDALRSNRSAIRSFYGWAHAAGLTAEDPSRLLRRVPATRGVPRPAPEFVINAALIAAENRVALMITLGSRYGLRRGEISRVHTRDLRVDPDGQWSLIVRGKGAKDRVVPLLADIAHVIRDAPPGYLFPSTRPQDGGRPLSPAWCGKLMTRAMNRKARPHQLRHRFASRSYQVTGDIRAVQELLGHSSVATTQVYTAVADGALRAAVAAAG